MNHIELFAGCGGLSLGLESTGFELVMANELSPMAAETYAYNFFKEDLGASLFNDRTLWLASQFPRQDMKSRLREDPRSFPKEGQGFSDLEGEADLNGKLIVGSIVQLNEWLSRNPSVLEKLRKPSGKELDLVSGGPPCQSFSLAGMRQLDNNRNTLPWEFAKFVGMTQPRVVLLENVTGILRAFDVNGSKFHAWYEVAKAFAKVNYVPLCLHVNAKFAGVAQNRPRFILLGIRHDVLDGIYPKMSSVEQGLFTDAISFVDKVRANSDLPYGQLQYLDVGVDGHMELFNNTFLSPLVAYRGKEFSVSDAIDDLREQGNKKSQYVKLVNSQFSFLGKAAVMANHDLRSNGVHVQRRFRIYQILQLLPVHVKKEALEVLKGRSSQLSEGAAAELMTHDYLIAENSYQRFGSPDELLNYLREHQTKKQTQKALLAGKPAPAALSIPDDACHYHHDELRTLTVREMARVQSFPDNFVFRSKVTTGGQMRQFEVPQYTQVGNAVPPLLGVALGRVVAALLTK